MTQKFHFCVIGRGKERGDSTRAEKGSLNFCDVRIAKRYENDFFKKQHLCLDTFNEIVYTCIRR